MRRYLIAVPLMWHSAMLQNASPPLLVQMTSVSVMFMNASHEASVPLYVSPFFSSTSCAKAVGVSDDNKCDDEQPSHHAVLERRLEKSERQLRGGGVNRK